MVNTTKRAIRKAAATPDMLDGRQTCVDNDACEEEFDYRRDDDGLESPGQTAPADRDLQML